MPGVMIWRIATAVVAAFAVLFWIFFAIDDHWIGNLVLAVILTALAALLWRRFASRTARAS